MEGRCLARLREEQDKAIQATEEQLSTWEKFKSDYTTLQEKLRTLPDKVSHPYNVPIGSKAFMPGKLVHTNEVLVLLGDNWFVERSAKQACEIIDRRLVGINKQISDLEKQRDLLRPRVDFTSELQDLAEARDGMVEIREDYDDAKEQKWKEQHRRNVLKQRRKEKEEREKLAKSQQVSETNKKPMSDEELWARLDQLERIETERKELSCIPMSDKRIDTKPSPTRETIVRWADQGDGNNEQVSSSGEEEEEEDELGGVERPKVIRFTHTQGSDHPCGAGGDNSISLVETDPPNITSPGDIYKLFQPTHPKSILKSKGETGMEPATEQSGVEEKTFLAHPAEAFSGAIVERDLDRPISSVTEGLVSGTVAAPVANPPKRISKFKADRQKKQNLNR